MTENNETGLTLFDLLKRIFVRKNGKPKVELIFITIIIYAGLFAHNYINSQPGQLVKCPIGLFNFTKPEGLKPLQPSLDGSVEPPPQTSPPPKYYIRIEKDDGDIDKNISGQIVSIIKKKGYIAVLLSPNQGLNENSKIVEGQRYCTFKERSEYSGLITALVSLEIRIISGKSGEVEQAFTVKNNLGCGYENSLAEQNAIKILLEKLPKMISDYILTQNNNAMLN